MYTALQVEERQRYNTAFLAYFLAFIIVYRFFFMNLAMGGGGGGQNEK